MKKYVPSGYQIIDLGKVDLTTVTTLQPNDGEDVKTLIDLFNSGRIQQKPILLTVEDSSSGLRYTGMCTTVANRLSLSGLIDDKTEYQCVTVFLGDDYIEVEMVVVASIS